MAPLAQVRKMLSLVLLLAFVARATVSPEQPRERVCLAADHALLQARADMTLSREFGGTDGSPKKLAAPSEPAAPRDIKRVVGKTPMDDDGPDAPGDFEDGGSDIGGSSDPQSEVYWYQTPILEIHNYYRCLHDAPPLVWHIGIEKAAKSWAAKGRGHKSPAYYRSNIVGFGLVGENLAHEIANASAARDALMGWYAEMPMPRGLVTERSRSTAAYTQMVWGSSTHIGCGLWYESLVCWYGPAGNVDGEYTTEVLPLSSSAHRCKVPDSLRKHPTKVDG
mmetsp:Transcript_106184/g.297260  ORF Transcript_106184/g.297260 Transcript_106184/m.297260 type:complete len:279 (-) Transcript_106184:323-1159(-)|eukprot:CAMPEP_0176192078 /NCGR_PEP_ID=MMETSP0121_2-20121125/4789_1 /TAXON_ID=160619 /ORGANISM="Kryptoperidinium foliaceum, Strain CCMP 1326" /LENGTH=278 /DNA_ID=CAMNT_0017530761 /DNA_START=71 /DNA_END=907 /DNA_ORIENTATION=-